MTSQAYIDEITADLQSLKKHENNQAAHFIAERVGQKINVLVRLCQQNIDKPTSEPEDSFDIQAISTRQQWLQTMQHDIDVLQAQHSALTATLVTFNAENNIQASLNLQVELGKVARHLTLAKEAFARSTVF